MPEFKAEAVKSITNTMSMSIMVDIIDEIVYFRYHIGLIEDVVQKSQLMYDEDGSPYFIQQYDNGYACKHYLDEFIKINI